jgi:hypothetical protein
VGCERGIAGVEGGVPVPVLLAEAHDDDVGTLVSDRVRMAFTPGTDVVVPELRSLVAGDRRAGIVGPGS